MSHDGRDRVSPRYLSLPDRRNFLKVLGVAGTGSLAGCTSLAPQERDGGGSGTGDRAVRGTYTTSTSLDAQSLNWLSTADTTSGSYVGRVLDGAWAIAEGQEIFPLWADIGTEDAKVYEITLRDNLQWGAGYGQMTADDWVYLITEVFQSENNWAAYPSADDWFVGGEPIPVEQTGELRFELRLPEVDPAFPFKPVLWGQECMPRGLVEQYAPENNGGTADLEGLKQDEEIQTLAYGGNLGPYTYERWERESQFRVVRNDDYYLKSVEELPERFSNAPYFEANVIRVIPEESSRLGALRSGEIDAAGIPPDKVGEFQQLEDVVINVTPQPFITPLVYNQRANGWTPFRKVEVRQALAHVIDKERLVNNIFRGFAEVAQTMQPSWSKWYDDSQVTTYGVGDLLDPETGTEMLASALSDTEYGYDGDTVVDGDGTPHTLTLTFDSGQNTEQTVAEFVAQEFGKVGLDVELKATSSFQQKFAANTPPEGTTPEWSSGFFNGGPRDVSTSEQPWDMSLNLGFNTYPLTPSQSATFFHERGGVNYYGYVPSYEFDRLYEEASQTVDEDERRAKFADVFGKLSEDQPFGFLAMSSSVNGFRSRVQGYTDSFYSGWDAQTWYFK